MCFYGSRRFYKCQQAPKKGPSDFPAWRSRLLKRKKPCVIVTSGPSITAFVALLTCQGSAATLANLLFLQPKKEPKSNFIRCEVNNNLKVVWMSNSSSSLFLPKFSNRNKRVEKFKQQDIPLSGDILYLGRVTKGEFLLTNPGKTFTHSQSTGRRVFPDRRYLMQFSFLIVEEIMCVVDPSEDSEFEFRELYSASKATSKIKRVLLEDFTVKSLASG